MTKFTQKILSKLGMNVETKGNEVDLVCGMELSGNLQHKVVHKGKAYYFCSNGCQTHFQDDPGKYIGE